MPATLPTQGRHTVAALVGSHRQFYRDVLRGVGDYAGRHGRWSICSEPTLFLEAGILSAIKQLPPRCEGVIALVTRDDEFAELRRRGLAVVNLSSVYTHPDLPTVVPDHAALAAAALGHFRERGLRQWSNGRCRTRWPPPRKPARNRSRPSRRPRSSRAGARATSPTTAGSTWARW